MWPKLAFLLSSLGALVSAGCPPNPRTLPTVTFQNGTFQGRSYHYYLPAQLDRSQGLILYLHGGHQNGQDASAGQSDCLWRYLSERVNVFVAFPNGHDSDNTPQTLSWNTCQDANVTETVDDVGFIEAVIDDIQSKWHTNYNRTYAAGISYGGMMVQRLALELNTRIAGIGNIAGNLPVSNDNHGTYECNGYTTRYAPSRQVGIFHFKGDEDPRLNFGSKDFSTRDPTQYCQLTDPYNRSTIPCFDGALHSFYDTVAFWQWKLNLSSSPTTYVAADAIFPYADTVNATADGCDRMHPANCDNSTVTRFAYGSTLPRKLVVERAYGGGHTFPGPDAQPSVLPDVGWKNRDNLGPQNNFIANEMWDFFSQFDLNS